MREGKWISGKFLLTPLREGRLCFLPVAADDVKISTHAPAGGATLRLYHRICDVPISTHAPAGGATRNEYQCRYSSALFLLTPLREGRPLRVWYGQDVAVISTHAPAGGATRHVSAASWLAVFLLTPLREGRLHLRPEHRRRTYFYSRPCGRGDETGAVGAQLRFDFYSRPCGRGDMGRARSYGSSRSISTHAPAGGATISAPRNRQSAGISTHAPAGGATWRVRRTRYALIRFLLTPLREGRLDDT